MKTVLSRTLAAVFVAGLPLGVATADVPDALDHIPANTPVVISIGNVNAFFAQAEAITAAMQQEEAAMGVMMAKMMLSMPGIDAEGSAAIALTSIDDLGGEEAPPMVILLPVTDYAALVTGLGGTGEGLEALDLEGTTIYAKNAGDGYAAVGPDEAALAEFDTGSGNSDAHEAMIGDTGSRMSDDNAILIIANMEELREPMMAGWAKANENMDQMMAMGGPQADQLATQMEMADSMITTFGRDAQRGLMGISGGDYGFSFEMGATFKEGTDLAAAFADSGDVSGLINKLPGGAYLFAYAFDYSAPGIQSMLASAAEMNEAAGGGIPGMNPMDFLGSSSGIAQVVGLNPAGLMGGLFVNTTAVLATDDANALVSMFGTQITDANDQVANGFSLTTEFAGEAEEVGGVDAYRWAIKMLPDMAQPGAMQMQMMMPMLFGPNGGPSGYIAAADENTTVVTYSTKASMLEKAVQSARDGGAFATDQLLMQQAERLHAEPFMVSYVDAGSIMNAVLPTMAMFGMAVNIDVPEHVSPLAMSMAATDGGVSFRTVVPTDLINLVNQTVEAVGGGMGGMGGGGEEEPPPSF